VRGEESEFDGKKDSLEGMEVRKGRLTYNGFFPKILMKASSTLQNSSCNSSYDSVVRSLWDQVWDPNVCCLLVSLYCFTWNDRGHTENLGIEYHLRGCRCSRSCFPVH
jgi:hypothetical protein